KDTCLLVGHGMSEFERYLDDVVENKISGSSRTAVQYAVQNMDRASELFEIILAKMTKKELSHSQKLILIQLVSSMFQADSKMRDGARKGLHKLVSRAGVENHGALSNIISSWEQNRYFTEKTFRNIRRQLNVTPMSLQRQSSIDSVTSRGSELSRRVGSEGGSVRKRKRKLTEAEVKALKQIEVYRKQMKAERLESCLRPKKDSEDAQFNEMWNSAMEGEMSEDKFWLIWEEKRGREWTSKYPQNESAT
ncbi:hypothetical protein AAMO2058_000568000, partial [Amorphochlora amoebiformis]